MSDSNIPLSAGGSTGRVLGIKEKVCCLCCKTQEEFIKNHIINEEG